MKRVSYFGPEHTNTHAAALQVFGSSAYFHPETTKTAVFDAVEDLRAEVGIVPIENSTEGVVRETLDALIRRRPMIFREFEMNISHCLMALPASAKKSPTRIVSHPQPLAQCRHYLAHHYPQVPCQSAISTASAAKIAAESPGTFAIATEAAAQACGLSLVATSIADRPDNATRFVCIALHDGEPSGQDKTSLVFSARHQRGGLLRVLSIFDQAGVNLTRIESRPRGDRMWEYDFVVDLQGHRLLSPVREAVKELKAKGALRKMLGSYARVEGNAEHSPLSERAP